MNTSLLQSINKNIEKHTQDYDDMVKKFNKENGFDFLEEETEEE